MTRAQMRQPARGHRFDAQKLGGLHTAVSGDHLVVVVDQDGIAEAKLFDAFGDLPNLLLGMRPGIVGIGSQVAHRRDFNFHCKSSSRTPVCGLLMFQSQSHPRPRVRSGKLVFDTFHTSCNAVEFESDFYGAVKITSGIYSTAGRAVKSNVLAMTFQGESHRRPS
jgi:hypothetical protein